LILDGKGGIAMSNRDTIYLLPHDLLESWWLTLGGNGSDWGTEVLSEATEPDGCVYHKIRFKRGVEEVMAISLPGPRDNALTSDKVTFILSLGLRINGKIMSKNIEHSLWNDIKSSLGAVGGQQVAGGGGTNQKAGGS